MTTLTIKLSPAEITAMKACTGRATADEALRAWVRSATPRPTAAQIRRALTPSSREFAAGKSRRFKTARAAMEWLES